MSPHNTASSLARAYWNDFVASAPGYDHDIEHMLAIYLDAAGIPGRQLLVLLGFIRAFRLARSLQHRPLAFECAGGRFRFRRCCALSSASVNILTISHG